MRINAVPGGLIARLQARRGEIEEATLTRIRSLADATEGADPEYLNGLRAAVSAAIDYGIEALGRSEDRPAPIPTALLSQARLAARHGVKLETVLRRYVAGYTLLGDFIVEESAASGSLSGPTLKRLLRTQSSLLDRLIAAVSEEYAREESDRPSTAERRRAQRVERLLAGEMLNTEELAYELEAHHVAMIASGPGAAEAVRELGSHIDARLLFVSRQESTVWAWLGGNRSIGAEEIAPRISQAWAPGIALALGEPGEGFPGWRQSHQQAKAALPVAQRGPEPTVRYADVALLACALQDEVLSTSLQAIYLDSFAAERDGGTVLRQTLRAYFATERIVSSTAIRMEADRKTIKSRLRTVERLLGRQISACAPELETALRLEEFTGISSPDSGIAPPQIP